jgi:hypothetical protein
MMHEIGISGKIRKNHVCLPNRAELKFADGTATRPSPFASQTLMHSIICNLAAVAVAGLFYAWRAHYFANSRQHRQLRERVAYLLWVVAQKAA